MPWRDPIKKREWTRKWLKGHPEKARKWRLKTYYKYREKWMNQHKEWLKNNPNWTKEYRKRIKIEVLTHYSTVNYPKCIQCGFEDLRALTIDHINGGGNKRRKQGLEGGLHGGIAFYLWLRRHNYPEGYQCLCFNCQFIKKRF